MSHRRIEAIPLKAEVIGLVQVVTVDRTCTYCQDVLKKDVEECKIGKKYFIGEPCAKEAGEID